MTALRLWLRILLFFLAFNLEVRVHAAEIVQLPNATEIQQEPADCLGDLSVACALHTMPEEKFKLILGESTVVLDQSTVVVRGGGSNSLTLVDGAVWVQGKTPVTVRTEYGEIKAGAGDFWVVRVESRVVVVASGVQVEMWPRGGSESIVVERGWENWLGRVNREGRAETGLPRAIQLKEHFERWARLYPGTKVKFEQDVKAFQEVWMSASKRAAEIHQILFNRKMASLEEEKAKKDIVRRAIEARDRELREMLRRKALDE